MSNSRIRVATPASTGHGSTRDELLASTTSVWIGRPQVVALGQVETWLTVSGMGRRVAGGEGLVPIPSASARPFG